LLVFFAKGQLGNQLFQYVFLKTIQKKDESILVSGFDDLNLVFQISDISYLNKKNLAARIVGRIFKRFLYLLSSVRIIDSIQVIHDKYSDTFDRETTKYIRIKGLISSLTYVKIGYFQSESFFEKKIAQQLKIKREYLNLANDFLSQCPEGSHLVFVHIRRGDYENFLVFGKSAVLPLSYYKDQIKYFVKNQSNCFFVFLSNDPKFVKKEFSFIDNKIISSGAHFGTDLAIMTKCQSAILSPSSFGWWGSYLIKNRETVFAPKYWVGFNSGFEINTNPLPEYVTEVTIS